MANMPGFNAQASLYRTSERYTGATSQANGIGGQAVVPQQFGCRCVSPCIRIPFLGRRCVRCCIFPPGCRVSSC